ncbi:unnamed protein product [Lasius platythorax]|uniref:Uncharacterized protein n=1 Tax=Lasius platythorax TaxID=488582 RepID=A0AAV2PAC1_9HYME
MSQSLRGGWLIFTRRKKISLLTAEIAFASRCQNIMRHARRSQVLLQQSALRQCSLAAHTSLTLEKVHFEKWTGGSCAWVGIENEVSDRFW